MLEKESRIRESMLMMGLKQWVLWSSWFLKQFLFVLISVIVMTILLKVMHKQTTMRQTDMAVIFVLLPVGCDLPLQ